MDRRAKQLMLVAMLVAVAASTSACELSLSVVDCSFIDQPDMGGLVCLGANMLTIAAGVLAIIAAVALGLGSIAPV